MSNIESIIFKVQLGKGLWRKIQISSDATLEDLSYEILNAYDFDYDHLYAFFMDNKEWSDDEVYWHPEHDEEPSASDVQLSFFQFEKGDKFKFVYDFGENWSFNISVFKLSEEAVTEPVIFDIKGESPVQYVNGEDFDDDYDEDYIDE